MLLLAFLFVTLPTDLIYNSEVIGTLRRLGYPPYLATILGIAKIFAAVSIIQVFSKRLKDWSASGLSIMFIGALVSHSIVDPVRKIFPPLICLIFLFVAYFFNDLRLTRTLLTRSGHTDEKVG